MRFFAYFVLMLLNLTSHSHANVNYNLESFIWGAQGTHDVGKLEYNGNAISQILVNVNEVNPGILYVKQSQCSLPNYDLYSYKEAKDHYIFIPKSVTTDSGQNITIGIHQIPTGYTMTDNAQQYVLYSKGGDEFKATKRRCQQIGNSFNFQSSWSSSFVLRLSTENLSIGKYSGRIPIKIARAEYYARTASLSLYRWTLDDIQRFVGSDDAVTLPFDINIQNKCTITPSEINFAHGGNSIVSADGHMTSQSVGVNCASSGNIALNLSLKAIDPPTNSYTDGVGVGLGNGWDSVLKIDGSNISTTNPTTKMTIPANSSFNVQSILRKTNNSQAGSLSGSAVMEVFIQ
ncbi:PapG chaperone-binding domain-containing protein [Yersinia enterocolitica]|uniref:PapG chaperone-binding domain-containing protein n=1 Tax=Yersinia enterocolitica TaxID=630 RepID=UPI001C60E3AF|nr:PapG chaperone-binding domain-containing protein [Yersinia enterocolitica]MBW5823293.1 papG chaperone-binding domain protein [Yersinia enterocolitica]MBW5853117.1 papG chaperone-binding domain protein [Yersinia enterocolitica]MBW5879373.1 papG chaperone-binding domain protein [Yersinia enterocolitica]